MKVLYVNNEGGGFASEVEVAEGTKVSEFCEEYTDIEAASADEEEFSPSNWKIRVNREPVLSNQVLEDGDKVTITPLNIKGA